MITADPLGSWNGRVWPPRSREPVEHLTGCAELLGGPGPSGSRCDCERDTYNDRMEAFWEGWDAALARVAREGTP